MVSDDLIYIWWCPAPPYVDEVVRDQKHPMLEHPMMK
jgi:hypothetical protein